MLNARDRGRTPRWNRNLIAAAVVALGCLLVVPAAQAVPSISVVPDFPTTASVGQTNVAASVLITNTGTDLSSSNTVLKPLVPGTSNYVGICNSSSDVFQGTPPGQCNNSQIGTPYSDGILLTPSCGQVVDPSVATSASCSAVDPGVFSISPTATGSGTCDGVTFDVVTVDASPGRYRFAPRAPATRVWLGLAGTSCRISFTVNVLKLPTIDANPALAGVQTRSISSAGGGFNNSATLDPNHVKPAPLRAVVADVTTLQVPPPPPVFCPPPNNTIVIPPGSTAAQVCPVAPVFCPPPDQTIVIPPGMTAAQVCPQIRLVDVMRADMSGGSRCRPTVAGVGGATKTPFNVTVRVTRVSGTSANFLSFVRKVEFRRNGKLIKTLTKATPGVIGGYRLHIDPRAFAPKHSFLPGGQRPHRRPAASRKYTITARVFLRAPGTFTANDPTDFDKTVSRSVSFRAVRTCSDSPKPPG